MFAAAAKSLQSCPILCDPTDRSHQAPPSLGFSRQEHWSGLPFPSPIHESEKWKGSRSVASDSSRPHGLQPIRLLRPWNFPDKSTGVGCHRLLRVPPIEHQTISSCVRTRLPADKPVSSLNLLSQRVSFHCRRAPFSPVSVGRWATGAETRSPSMRWETLSWKQGVDSCTLCLHH